jgi:hypothetical protein
MVLNALSRVAAHVGDADGATGMIKESLLLRKELGDRQGLAEGLETMAILEAATQPPSRKRAARLLGAAHGLRQAIGAPVPAIDRAEYDRLVEQVRGFFTVAEAGSVTPGEVAFSEAFSAGEALASHPPEKLLEQALGGNGSGR